ncbi:PepSY domain-containing protein [Akkermansiaceae bacterium]|nr:PepSY domain-containing protein [Akkermansiaceae bacterium]
MARSGIIRTWTRGSHRVLGMALLLPLTVVCVTGLILNHTVDLGLSNRHTTAGWIQARYGMTLDGEPEAFGIDGKAHAASWDGQLFFREKSVDDSSPLVGAVPLRDGTAVVTGSAVHYFGLDGELIETLGPPTLPESPIIRAGRTQDLALTLETESGIFTGDANLLDFAPAPAGQEVTWSAIATPSAADRKQWATAFSGDGIPLDRVILDIHSGRFFGTIGKWIYDLTVIGVLILSATGFVLFFRTRRRAK